MSPPAPPGAAENQMTVYRTVMRAAAERKISFAIGGSLAMLHYMGAGPRSTKDLDLYIVPESREAMIGLLAELGFWDYYKQLPYDRNWIYRGFNGDTIIDIIWSMANSRATVDEEWLTLGKEVEFAGETHRLIPIEEMIWSKLYVLQKDRCDWPDILNMIHSVGGAVDWQRLARRTGPDTPLLASVLNVYRWMHCDRDIEFPPPIFHMLAEPSASCTGDTSQLRARLLDSRPWLHPPEKEGE